MKHVAQLVTVSIILSLLFSCGGKGQTSGLKNITGRPGELVIIINSEIWEGTVDSIFSSVLEQPQLGLPQSEAIFKLTNVPFKAFADIFKTSRNLILVKVSDDVDSSAVYFTQNKYAYPQAVVLIEAKNKATLLELFNSTSDKIIGYFLKAEKDRLIQSYQKLNEKVVTDKAKALFSVSVNVPPGFKISSSATDFMWARYETPEISQGICSV